MFLATGSCEDAVQDFHVAVCLACNFIDRRQNTSHYTCMSEDADVPIEAAKQLDVTLEEILSVDGEETYQMIYQGTPPGWQAHLDRQSN